MRFLFVAVCVVFLSSCGYVSRQNEASGQVKRVHNETPLFCPDYVDADISLGVMRNGIGSMSTEDILAVVPREADQGMLKLAAQTGQIVKIQYDQKRVAFCKPALFITNVELIP